MTYPHPAAWPHDRLLAECDTRRTRRSGPGGQHRNKVETAVVLTHRPTGLSVEAGERRSQERNHRVALFRLRLKLALDFRSAPEETDRAARTPAAERDTEESRPAAERGSPASPSALWNSRSRGGRIHVSPRHDDFPALLAEALDAIAANDRDVKAAADRLGVSISQLVKLLKFVPPALERINEHRRRQGRPTLK